jgi:hypothetical protein
VAPGCARRPSTCPRIRLTGDHVRRDPDPHRSAVRCQLFVSARSR